MLALLRSVFKRVFRIGKSCEYSTGHSNSYEVLAQMQIGAYKVFKACKTFLDCRSASISRMFFTTLKRFFRRSVLAICTVVAFYGIYDSYVLFCVRRKDFLQNVSSTQLSSTDILAFEDIPSLCFCSTFCFIRIREL